MPEEFAAAYAAPYARALAATDRSGGRSTRRSRRAPHPPRCRRSSPLPTARRTRRADGSPRARPEHAAPDSGEELPAAVARCGYDHTTPPRSGGLRLAVWFVPLLLVLLALLLVLGAYVVGRALADRLESGGSGAEPTVVMREDGRRRATADQPAAPGRGGLEGRGCRGSGSGETGCTSPSGVDAAGDEITYGAANLTDGAADTTWRCDGRAVGEKITLDLGGDRRVAEVGLIPGYAKTDDQSGADRYAENNRVTLARWTIGDEVVEQRIPDDWATGACG